MQHHLAELLEFYCDEIAGEAFFSALAQNSSEPQRAAQWRMLASLERMVAGRLRAALEVHGVSMPTLATDQRRGVESAQAYAGLAWGKALERLRPELDRYVSEFQAAESRMPEDLLPLAQFVTAHERALLQFVTRELDQDGKRSLDGVLALIGGAAPDTPPREPSLD
jgi:hypothetical protein